MQIPIQESKFDYKGFTCVVLFMPMGHRCGYVGLPKDKTVKIDDIGCHGGITYSHNHLILQDEKKFHWIGFDCGHCFDKPDYENALNYYKDNSNLVKQLLYMKKLDEMYPTGACIRTKEYVENECKKIVDQIIGGAK